MPPKPLAAKRGSAMLFTIVFGSLAFSLIIIGLGAFGVGEYRAARHRQAGSEALAIAEAGLNYYRWHLQHNPTDYTDGTSGPGPYVHDFVDAQGQAVGQFSLVITPPSVTTSTVLIESTGYTRRQSATRRTIRAVIGYRSLTDYAFVSNSQVWVGNNSEFHGSLHSNSGLRFDGTTDSPVTSAVETYQCQPIHGNGCGGEMKPGVWGQGGPVNFWKFPVPAVDFGGPAGTIARLKAMALDGGQSISSSGEQGWRLTFAADGTFTTAKVTATKCYKGRDLNDDKDQWYCVDIKTAIPGQTYAIPGNGVIFVDDTVWVDGTIKGKAVVVAGSGKSIIINDDILYSAKDGANRLGLVGETDVLLPHDAPDDLEIDAALFAVNGSAKRYYYSGDHKDTLTLYGAVASYKIWTWSYVSQGGAVVSGFNRIIDTHDPALTYNPPPGFPASSDLATLSWEEVK